MGHIDLARFIFYKGAYGPYGREIDAIARRPLWQIGLDYRHGTGHFFVFLFYYTMFRDTFN
jgi:Xaa-Pro aminopeptidase